MSDDFAERRASARARLDALDPHKTPGGVAADPLRRGWFEAVYALAERDPAGVPWANLAPHPLLAEWLCAHGPLTGLRALDVGCGLGDNALALAKAGARVTAFDLVAGAIDWARQRFPGEGVEFRRRRSFRAASGMARGFRSRARVLHAPGLAGESAASGGAERWRASSRRAAACWSSPARVAMGRKSPVRPGR